MSNVEQSGGDVFVVGCPRSGTTWVHAVLAHLPDVVCPPETDLFIAVSAAERYRDIRAVPTGLRTVVTQHDYEDWLADLWRRVRTRLLAAIPGSRVVVEKTPDHVLHIDTIRRLVPGARFVLVQRDPRDVVASLLHAGRTWGTEWAPTTVEDAARFWLQRVRAGLSLADERDTVVAHYERLREGEAEWRRITDFLGYPGFVFPDRSATPESISSGRVIELVGDRLEPTALVRHDREGATSFHRRKESEQPTLTPYERRYVELVCAREMQLLGYSGSRQNLGLADRLVFQRRRLRRVLRRLRGTTS